MTITRDQVQKLWDSITGADKPLRFTRAVLQQFGTDEWKACATRLANTGTP